MEALFLREFCYNLDKMKMYGNFDEIRGKDCGTIQKMLQKSVKNLSVLSIC